MTRGLDNHVEAMLLAMLPGSQLFAEQLTDPGECRSQNISSDSGWVAMATVSRSQVDPAESSRHSLEGHCYICTWTHFPVDRCWTTIDDTRQCPGGREPVVPRPAVF